MLIDFFMALKRSNIPVSLREYMDLLEAMNARLVYGDLDEFYYLSRAIMVKDETHFDRFDVAFGRYFKGLETLEGIIAAFIPEEWLRKAFEESLTPEERAKIESLGGLEKLIEEFKKLSNSAHHLQAACHPIAHAPRFAGSGQRSALLTARLGTRSSAG